MLSQWRLSFVVLTAAFLMGCAKPSFPVSRPSSAKTTPPTAIAAEAEPSADADIAAELAKLPPDERKLVEAQEWCAISSDERLGSMGPPIKLDIKGQPVFLCCGGCKKKALADPDKTLAKVEELKAKKKKQASGS